MTCIIPQRRAGNHRQSVGGLRVTQSCLADWGSDMESQDSVSRCRAGAEGRANGGSQRGSLWASALALRSLPGWEMAASRVFPLVGGSHGAFGWKHPEFSWFRLYCGGLEKAADGLATVSQPSHRYFWFHHGCIN